MARFYGAWDNEVYVLHAESQQLPVLRRAIAESSWGLLFGVWPHKVVYKLYAGIYVGALLAFVGAALVARRRRAASQHGGILKAADGLTGLAIGIAAWEVYGSGGSRMLPRAFAGDTLSLVGVLPGGIAGLACGTPTVGILAWIVAGIGMGILAVPQRLDMH